MNCEAADFVQISVEGIVFGKCNQWDQPTLRIYNVYENATVMSAH